MALSSSRDSGDVSAPSIRIAGPTGPSPSSSGRQVDERAPPPSRQGGGCTPGVTTTWAPMGVGDDSGVPWCACCDIDGSSAAAPMDVGGYSPPPAGGGEGGADHVRTTGYVGSIANQRRTCTECGCRWCGRCCGLSREATTVVTSTSSLPEGMASTAPGWWVHLQDGLRAARLLLRGEPYADVGDHNAAPMIQASRPVADGSATQEESNRQRGAATTLRWTEPLVACACGAFTCHLSCALIRLDAEKDGSRPRDTGDDRRSSFDFPVTCPACALPWALPSFTLVPSWGASAAPLPGGSTIATLLSSSPLQDAFGLHSAAFVEVSGRGQSCGGRGSFVDSEVALAATKCERRRTPRSTHELQGVTQPTECYVPTSGGATGRLVAAECLRNALAHHFALALGGSEGRRPPAAAAVPSASALDRVVQAVISHQRDGGSKSSPRGLLGGECAPDGANETGAAAAEKEDADFARARSAVSTRGAIFRRLYDWFSHVSSQRRAGRAAAGDAGRSEGVDASASHPDGNVVVGSPLGRRERRAKEQGAVPLPPSQQGAGNAGPDRATTPSPLTPPATGGGGGTKRPRAMLFDDPESSNSAPITMMAADAHPTTPPSMTPSIVAAPPVKSAVSSMLPAMQVGTASPTASLLDIRQASIRMNRLRMLQLEGVVAAGAGTT